MAYHRTVTIKRSRKTAKYPVRPDWEEYKDYMKSRGQILTWKISEFDSDNMATLKIVTDSKESWRELVNKAGECGGTASHPLHKVISNVEG